MTISLIAAVSSNWVIGKDGDLPWHLPRDLKFFSDTTKGHHVLMGRKNFHSIPRKFRPLPGRVNVVVSRDTNFKAEGVIVFYSINEAIEYAREKGETELFIIGGGEIYTQCLDMADKLYLTHVDAEIEGETLFPKFDLKEWDRNLILDQSANDVHKFSFKTYEYKRLD